jgi:magnesium-transporting ATPase (P-type)
MHDPPRSDVTEAVQKCHEAHVRIFMITGDYGITAVSIARTIGIVRSETPTVITGAQLSAMNDLTLRDQLRGEVVFARMAPDQKLRIVHTLQSMGEVVAVTGDGVNDAPALKQADIGVAMGATGTEVARQAADMILTDDHFGTIVNAVEEGRAVYENIRRFATYIFSSNVPEAVPFALLLFSRGAIPLPLTIMQILSVDLGTDMIPAIGLGAEPPEPGLMTRPPRRRTARIATPRLLGISLLWYGCIEACFATAAYFFYNYMHGWPALPLASTGTSYRAATTISLAAVVMAQVGLVLACRAHARSIFTVNLFANRLVLLGIACELLLLVALMHVPALQKVFHTAPLSLYEWMFVATGPLILLALDELRKLLTRGFPLMRSANKPGSLLATRAIH